MNAAPQRGQAFGLPVAIGQIADLPIANLVNRPAAIELLSAAPQAEHGAVANQEGNLPAGFRKFEFLNFSSLGILDPHRQRIGANGYEQIADFFFRFAFPRFDSQRRLGQRLIHQRRVQLQFALRFGQRDSHAMLAAGPNRHIGKRMPCGGNQPDRDATNDDGR